MNRHATQLMPPHRRSCWLPWLAAGKALVAPGSGRVTRRAGRRGIALREKRNKDCVFWDERAGCRVYRARPLQCRTYPFGSAIVQSQEQEGASCPGLGKGRLHAAAEVASMACDDGIPPSRTRDRMRARGARCE